MIYVCTMNLKVFCDFGWRLLDTFESHYKGSGKMIVYSEDKFFLSHLQNFNFSKIDCSRFGDELARFSKKANEKKSQIGVRYRISFQGLKNFLRFKSFPKIKLLKYDYMYDSKRFCFKSLAWANALKRFPTEICYLDADCHFFSDFDDYDFLKEVDGDVGYFGRSNYTETGVLIFKNNNFNVIELGHCVENFYNSGDIYKLQYYTDCHVFDASRIMLKQRMNFTDLSPSDIPHPIAKSYLSKFLDHRKGPRKALNKSPELGVNLNDI